MKWTTKFIINYFKPSLYLKSFKDLNPYLLKENGIKLLICDLDNTLVPHYTRLPNHEVINFLKQFQKEGIKVIIVSNNSKKRVEQFCSKLQITGYYGNAKKPLKKIGLKILNENKFKNNEVLMLGDQLVTDILFANRLKIDSVLIQPLLSVDISTNKFNLFLEKLIYKRLERNNILRRGLFDQADKFNEYQLL